LVRLASNHLFFTSNLISVRITLLYKRTFRKEKEVVTFLIKALKWNLAIKPTRPPCHAGCQAGSLQANMDIVRIALPKTERNIWGMTEGNIVERVMAPVVTAF